MKKRLKRYFLKSLILVAAGFAVISCIQDRTPGSETPASDGVGVHVRMRTPNPIQFGTRAADDPEYALNRVALMVFSQNGGTGDFLYRYTVAGRNLDQTTNTEVDFEAFLEMSEEPVRLLAVANYPDGALDGIAAETTENEVREVLLSDDFDFSLSGLPMTGAKELDGISDETGVIRISMMCSIAKFTITKDLRESSPDFTLTSVSVWRANDSWQYFPHADSVADEETVPLAVAPSIPSGAGILTATPVTVADDSQPYTGYIAEAAANEDAALVTCIVLGGVFEGDLDTTYYRIDFGAENDVSTMGRILRNFWYKFTIVGVDGSGWATPEEAAENPASGLQTTVTPWNGGGNTDHYFGDNDYIKLIGRDSMYLDAVIDHTDSLVIVTSEVPFTITSIRMPGAGALDTVDPSQTLETDIMSFTLTPLPGAPVGEQMWELEVTATTDDDSTIDYLELHAADGLMTIRIKIQRNPPETPPVPAIDRTKRKIRVYSLGSNTYGSLSATTTRGVPALLRNTSYFGPEGTVQCGGFEFVGVGAPIGTTLENLLKDVDIIATTYAYGPSAATSQIIYDWMQEPGHVAFLTSDSSTIIDDLRGMIDSNMAWFDEATIDNSGYVANYDGVRPAAATAANAPFLDGIFGSAYTCAVKDETPYDSATQFIGISTANTRADIVPLMVPVNTGGVFDDRYMLWGVDPSRRTVYLGEALMYHDNEMGTSVLAYESTNYINVMWSNLWAWAVDTVMTENYDVPEMTDVE